MKCTPLVVDCTVAFNCWASWTWGEASGSRTQTSKRIRSPKESFSLRAQILTEDHPVQPSHFCISFIPPPARNVGCRPKIWQSTFYTVAGRFQNFLFQILEFFFKKLLNLKKINSFSLVFCLQIFPRLEIFSYMCSSLLEYKWQLPSSLHLLSSYEN